MINRIIISIACCVLPLLVQAQRLIGEAPTQVAVGDRFQLTYTVNTQNISKFQIGSIPEGLEILYSAESQQNSIQIINGHTSVVSSVTFTYTIYAHKKGTYTISPAQIIAGGKTIRSNKVSILVDGQNQQQVQSRSQQGATGRQQNGRDNRQAYHAGTKISNSELFIKVSANKQRVYEQEPLLLTYKVYTSVDLTQLDGKMPDLKGFHTQEVQLPRQKSPKLETINGHAYQTVTWSQYVLFPQLTGKLEIPSITFEGRVVQRVQSVDWLEAMLNGGSGYVEVKKQIKAPGLTIQVDPLPSRPASFSGGVGRFEISSQLDKTEVKANDPVTLRVIVSGAGNMKLLKEPIVKFPKDFDTYDAKVTDKTKLTVNGVEGNIVYDFLAVPRHPGSYEIPAVEFTYYNLSAKSYKTIKTKPIMLNVTKGSESINASSRYNTQEDVKQLSNDIRYIKTGEADSQDIDDLFFGSERYWTILIAFIIGSIILYTLLHNRALNNENITKKKASRANKIATKRLLKGRQIMLAGNSDEFYDEVLRALWGYVGDKLNIPVNQLSRENINQQLSERMVDEETVKLFIEAIDECEFERYAPGDTKGNMKKTFDAAMTAITKIENNMKHQKKLMTFLLLLLILLIPLSSSAVTKESADNAYANQHYQQAAQEYEKLLRSSGVSAELYYNLGNSYYRMDSITKAVLNYERALLLAPGDRDTRFNLQMAQSKTIDKITPENEMFFVTWYRSLVNIASVDEWAVVSLIALALAIITSLIYFFSNYLWLQKTSFFCSLFFIIAFLSGTLFAYQQKKRLSEHTGAIIISVSVPIKSTPSHNGTDLFLLHEGTKVEISDSTMKNWKKIVIADGKEGWIENSNIEII